MTNEEYYTRANSPTIDTIDTIGTKCRNYHELVSSSPLMSNILKELLSIHLLNS